MSFVNWVIDTLASEDVIDLYFVLSYLVDINLSEAEIQEMSHGDAQSLAQSSGVTQQNGKWYVGGKCVGRTGKACW